MVSDSSLLCDECGKKLRFKDKSKIKKQKTKVMILTQVDQAMPLILDFIDNNKYLIATKNNRTNP